RVQGMAAARDRRRGAEIRHAGVSGVRRTTDLTCHPVRHVSCILQGMPRGSKAKYSSKQKRQAHHIEESAKKRGYSSQIGYATVNKQDGGGKKSGSGSGKRSTKSSSRASARS